MTNLQQRLSYTSLAITALLHLHLQPAPVTSEQIFSIHGSGTTNPRKCFWNIMSKIQDQSKAFTRLTYRAVGSGTGQAEFIGKGVPTGIPVPVNDFGSGDIPFSIEKYNSLKKGGSSTVVHLPFVVSGVSFFHSVPNVPQGKGGLNLTSCLLAQIFNGNITTWEDPEIVALNPNLLGLLGHMKGDSLPIKVAHRWEGSSSTKSITQYLNQKCPQYWAKDMVNKNGKEIIWAQNSYGDQCDGSGEMTKCIRKEEGTIGYVDAGHGWDEGLTEIELQNKAGKFISSYDSFNSGGTGVAATKATQNIASFDASFDNVDLLDQEGDTTWPILVMSYIYVRTNIDEYITDPGRLGLLHFFLKAMYMTEYIDECKQYGFTPVPKEVRDKALDTIDTKVNFAGAQEWTYMGDINPIDGQGDWVITPKRRGYAELERSTIAGDLAVMNTQTKSFDNVNAILADLMKSIDAKDKKIEKLETDFKSLNQEQTDHDSSHHTASVFAIISFVLWCLTLVYLVVTKFFLSDGDMKHNDQQINEQIA